jgi:hypothetical protein
MTVASVSLAWRISPLALRTFCRRISSAWAI